jgi:hypothetical protein
MVIFVPPAGILTVILALFAAVISMPTFNEKMKNPWLRSLAILVFCLIAAAEIAVISHADRVSESHFQYMVSRFNNTDRLVADNIAAQQRVTALRPTIKPHAVPPVSLKERAIHLSADILSFLTQRLASEPPLPRRETWEQDMQMEANYFKQTMAIYSQTFGAKVIAIHNELASKGITDRELDSSYENPINPNGIRTVAERIGALAERLPD